MALIVRASRASELCQVFAAGLIVACHVTASPADAGPTPLPEPSIHITTPQGATIVAELADTVEKRARGLMFRETLPRGRGMLFTFAEPQLWSFWMKNTRISLDIIWMDGNKRIIHIERNVPICTRTDDGCPQYQPNEGAMYVLELAAGSADALKLARGARLRFDLPQPSIPPRRPGPR
jgi:hypothetical protein